MSTVTVGLTQLPNHTDTGANAARILGAIAQWGARGVDLVVFPECALTGFSARHGDATPETIRAHVDAIERAAITQGLAVVLPSARLDGDEAINSGWWLGAGLERSRFDKTGLTESERLYFTAPESPGVRVVEVGGARFGVLICREVDDDPERYLGDDPPDVVLWPGYWGWDAEDGWDPEVGGAYALTRRLERPLLQATFSRNEGTTHRGAGPHGLSVVVGRGNELARRGPWGEDAGIEVTLTRRGGSWDVLESAAVAPIGWGTSAGAEGGNKGRGAEVVRGSA